MASLSIIIASKGESSHLWKLIELLETRMPNVQIILVDNSPTKKLAHEYNNKKLQYVHSSKPGVSLSRNLGASNATTDYIYFFDDDILPEPEWFVAITIFLNLNIITDHIAGGPVRVQDVSKMWMPSQYRFLIGEKNLGDHDKKVKKSYLAGCNILFSSDVFKKLGGFPQHYGHQGSKVLLNEDVYIQEKARKMGYDIWYLKEWVVTHYCKNDTINLQQRVSLQGTFDRKLDNDLNRHRLLMRFIKYTLFLFLYQIFIRHVTKKQSRYYFDFIRYSSYLHHGNSNRNSIEY